MTEDEMVRLHHRLNGHEFEQALGDSGGQRIRHNLATEQKIPEWPTGFAYFLQF